MIRDGRTRRLLARWLCAAAVVLACGGPVLAQDAAPPADPAVATPQPADQAASDKQLALILGLHEAFEQGQEPALRESVGRLGSDQLVQLEGEVNYVEQALQAQFDGADNPLSPFLAAVRRAVARQRSILQASEIDLSRWAAEAYTDDGGGEVLQTSTSGSAGGGGSSGVSSGSSGGGGSAGGGGGGSGTAGGGGSGATGTRGGGGGSPATTSDAAKSLGGGAIGSGSLGGTLPVGGVQSLSTAEAFPVFDALRLQRRPSTDELGLRHIAVLYGIHTTPDKPADEQTVRKLARATRPGELVCIDIENWRLENWLVADASEAEQNIDRFIQVITWIREENPTAKVGLYGVLPPGWKSRDGSKLQVDIERSKRLAGHVDFIAPSFYTSQREYDDWEESADWLIRNARIYGKPIFPFLWFRYHDGLSPMDLRLQPLPMSVWRKQLDYVRQHADGAIIWSNFQDEWVPNAPWYRELETFLAEPMPVNWAD